MNMAGRKSRFRVRPRAVPVGGLSAPNHSVEAIAALALQSLGEGNRLDRRGFMRGMALAGALAGMALAGCVPQSEPAEQQVQRIIPTPAPRLRAAFSHN